MLEAVRLINCQSIVDDTLEFATDRVNVIVAENNTGKSILFKMLKFTANPNWMPNKKRKQMIRHGADSASMLCGFTDGSMGITTITPNSIFYRFKNADSDEFTTYTEAPAEYLDHLGLVVNSKSRFIANIIDTDQDMLLVTSDQKGNNELLCALAECPELIDVKDKVMQTIKSFTDANTKLLIKETSLQQVLSGLEHEDVEALERTVNNSEALYDALSTLYKVEISLNAIEDCLADTFNYSYCIELLDTIQVCKQVSSSLNEICCENVIDDNLIQAITPIEGACKVIRDIEAVSPVQFDTNLIESLIGCVKCLEDITVETRNYNTELLDALLCLKNCMGSIHAMRNSYNSIFSIETDCCRIKDDILRSGEKTQCPIYGEVIYNGEECIPYNF